MEFLRKGEAGRLRQASGVGRQCQQRDTAELGLLPAIDAGAVVRADHRRRLSALTEAAINDHPELGPPLEEVSHLRALVGAAAADHDVVDIVESLAHGETKLAKATGDRQGRI